MWWFKVQIEESVPETTLLQLGTTQAPISNGTSPQQSGTPSPGSPNREMTAYSSMGVSQGVAEDSGSIMPSGAQLTQLTTHISYTGGGLEGSGLSSGALAK